MIIEHGRRIRACFKQPEFAPVSVPAQIAVLLALTAKLFDRIPLDQMAVAEQAVRTATADIPAEVGARFETGKTLSDEDRKTIIEIASNSLKGFSLEPDFKSEPAQEIEEQPKPEATAESKSESKSKECTPEAERDAKQEREDYPVSEAKSESNPEPKSDVTPASHLEPERNTKEAVQATAQAESNAKPGVKSGETTADPAPKAPHKEKP